MQILQGLVAGGRSTVPALVNALESGDVPTRMQVYLASHFPIGRLKQVFEPEQARAVRHLDQAVIGVAACGCPFAG